MKTKRPFLILSAILFLLVGTSVKTKATRPDKYLHIQAEKCYTGGVHSGWKNSCSPGLEACIATNCDPA